MKIQIRYPMSSVSHQNAVEKWHRFICGSDHVKAFGARFTLPYLLATPTRLGHTDSHILSSFLPESLSIHQQHHCQSSPYCPFFVILIATAGNLLSGTIPTEIGQLTELDYLGLGKFDGCLRSFHAPIAAGLPSHMKTAFSPIGFIASNNLSGSIPTEIGFLLDLEAMYLGRYSFVGNSDASSIRTLIFCPLFSVNRSQFTNNTIVIHRHIVHFL
jgi:hypothetical protein